ncbi:hypothetical protein, partial [Salmonella enterica]
RRTASCFEPKPTGPILNRISMLHDTEHWLVPVATKKGDCRVYAGYCFQSHRNSQGRFPRNVLTLLSIGGLVGHRGAHINQDVNRRIRAFLGFWLEEYAGITRHYTM